MPDLAEHGRKIGAKLFTALERLLSDDGKTIAADDLPAYQS
jgi:hypothetical protein